MEKWLCVMFIERGKSYNKMTKAVQNAILLLSPVWGMFCSVDFSVAGVSSGPDIGGSDSNGSDGVGSGDFGAEVAGIIVHCA